MIYVCVYPGVYSGVYLTLFVNNKQRFLFYQYILILSVNYKSMIISQFFLMYGLKIINIILFLKLKTFSKFL